MVAASACALRAHQVAVPLAEVTAASSYSEVNALVMEADLMWGVPQNAQYLLARQEVPRCS